MALLDRFERFLDQVIPAPDEVAASVRLGESLLAADDAAGALRVADEALAVAPGFLRALALRADALAALGRLPDALAALDAAHRERALPAALLARMVELRARLGDEAAALALEPHVRARLRGARDPEVARRFLAAARALLADGRESAGLRLARAATAVDGALGEPWLLLGRDALARGDRALARRSLDRGAAAVDPTDAPTNRLAGDLAWALGDRPTAARCLRRAWIAGDEGAIAPLVAVLAAGDDAAALERVLVDARGELGDVARGLLELARGRAAPPALAAVPGGRVPEVLWHYALDVALRDAPALAERWCADAPARPSAGAVLALRAAAGRPLAPGDLASLAPALADPATRPFARAALREGLRLAWRGRLGPMLDDLAAILGGHRASAALVDALGARRRELDGPLRVVVLGEFSAGKSTFLNALAGAEVSPMGVLPTTAHVHVLRHGAPGARVLDRRGDVVETSVEECARAVARRREAGVAIDRVEVTLPLPALARLELVDTPGFNSGDPAHDDAARRAVALADVALWLFDARQAGRHSEAEAIAEVAAAGAPVVGVLNKVDQVPEGERGAVLRVLAEGLGDRAPLVAAVSARAALAAMRAGGLHDDAAEAPGWAALLAWIDAGLVGARATWKDARVAGRARALLDEARAAREARAERARARVAAARALGEALGPVREALARAGAALRREVEANLRDQLRALAEGRGDDRDALAADAVAEACWRARERGLAGLRARVAELERLGVAAGLAPGDAPELLSAPLVQWLDHAAAWGARDAAARAPTENPAPAGDPLAWLEAAADRAARAVDAPDDALDVALDVAREELDRYTPPEARTNATDPR